MPKVNKAEQNNMYTISVDYAGTYFMKVWIENEDYIDKDGKKYHLEAEVDISHGKYAPEDTDAGKELLYLLYKHCTNVNQTFDFLYKNPEVKIILD